MNRREVSVGNLSLEERVALERQLLSNRPARRQLIPRRQQDAPPPLSFGQQRLWILHQMESELTAYNMAYAWRLRGKLNAEALCRAFKELVRRHEPLRTSFALDGDQPVQVIGTCERFVLPVEDLSTLQEEQRQTEIDQHRRSEAERPFDLSSDLMLRASLLRLAENEHLLLLTLHHIASDGWSHRVLWRELETLYNAYCGDTQGELPEPKVQYADYAVWQRQQLSGERLTRLLQYWRDQLQGMGVLELPTALPRTSTASYHADCCEFELPERLVAQLKTISQSAGATLQMTLLAAFQTLLSRYSGQHDIAVGTPTAGRRRAELEDLIGFFVNTLVLRTDFSGDPSFRELLARVREVSLAAYDHEDLPFEKLVEELQPERHLGRSPLVQVMFQLMSFPDTPSSFRDLEVLRLPPASRRVRFDLELYLRQQSERVLGSAVFRNDLFDRQTIERMMGHFIKLLEGIVANADQRISELPLLTDPERDQLLVQWNDTATPFPRHQCVHELFEQQVDRTPDAVAVVFQDQQLTYRQLNERANQLAHHLRGLGVGPNTLVGLCLERSAELVVSILGILKAGGAYLPLDADLPRQRLEFMQRDGHIPVLVTGQAMLDRLPSSDCHVVCLDSVAKDLNDLPDTNPSVGMGADSLAYVMFTSGSTGQPKGVAIDHSSITRLVFGNDYARFGPDRVFLQLATVSFDASTFELWGALLHGGKLVIAPDGPVDLARLKQLLQIHGVTTLWLTATLFNQVIDHDPRMLRGVDELLTGGEALSVRHICKAQSVLGPGVQLINGYGPTESTTFTTCYRIPPGIAAGLESIPIGRPIGNTQVYVLDRQQQPVPIGMPGELYIGGDGLARGYLHHPELTAERFVAHPWSDDPDARLYRTEDLCRWRDDGNLEFIGRHDDQVKLRGFRIELGEIEAALNEHPKVAQGVVLLREDHPGDKRLVAYSVPAMNCQPSSSELKDHLRSQLPNYMLPAAFVTLQSMPLTTSNKVDRRALPPPDESHRQLETEFVAPRTVTERQLADLWRDVVGVEEIGIDDDFFAIGGHSLLAVQLFARIEEMFDRKLPLATLFQHGTIRELSELLIKPGQDAEIATILPLQSTGEGRPLFLMPSIGGELLFSRTVIAQLGRRFPLVGLQPALAAKNVDQFRDFTNTARHFVKAIREYQPEGPYSLSGFSYGGLLAFEVACQLTELGETIDVLAVIDTGPGRRGLQPKRADSLRALVRNVANFPSWLREEFRDFSASRWVESVGRKVRSRRVSAGGKIKELDDLFDTNSIPSQNRELMRTVFAAFRDYQPRHYHGKLTLLRAKTRSLLGAASADLGWDRFVESLEIRAIPGNHETILHPPHVSRLAGNLAELLEARR